MRHKTLQAVIASTNYANTAMLLISDEKGKFDELVEQNGVQVLIDSPALMHLFGTKIDFVTDRIR